MKGVRSSLLAFEYAGDFPTGEGAGQWEKQRSPQPRKFSQHYLFALTSCGISCRFQQLSPAEGQVSYVLRTRSPLTCIAACPFDLHVLGTPPAFILSQDQTLRITFYRTFIRLFLFADSCWT